MSQEAVEKYLASNPEFARKWYMENIGKEGLAVWASNSSEEQDCIVEGWLGAGINSGSADMQTVLNGPRRFSWNQSGQLASPNFSSALESVNHRRSTLATEMNGNLCLNKINKSSLLRLSHRELLLELVKDISNELDVDKLCFKILQNVAMLTNSERGSMFLAMGQGHNKYLVPKLWDVHDGSSIDDALSDPKCGEIKIPFGKGIVGTVALKKQSINIADVYKDKRFNKEIDMQTGIKTVSLLSGPIVNYEGELIGVAQIMNKNDGAESFSQEDVEVFNTYLSFCGIGLSNAQLFDLSVEEYRRNQMLLSLARNIFSEQTNLDKLVTKIMIDGLDVMKCERCSIYLLKCEQDDLKNQVEKGVQNPGDLLKSFKNNLQSTAPVYKSPEDVVFFKGFELTENHAGKFFTHEEHQEELKNSINAKIAKEVVYKKERRAIVNATYQFQRDQNEGFVMQNMMCVPIRDTSECVIGAVQFMNKVNCRNFTDEDIATSEAFVIFAGLGVHNCQMYERVCKLMAKQAVALEVLSYHTTSSQSDAVALQDVKVPTTDSFQLDCFDFDDELLTEKQTCQATLRMFMDSGVMETFNVPYDVLCRWTLSVKKNYRPVTYHNWRHGFNVAQTMFTILKSDGVKQLLSDLEKFSLLVACLCHDLDHRGTNNTFQSKIDSPLANLYSTSIMERHHFNQCLMILSNDENNIFKNLSDEQYRKAIKIVENAIIATDLALYFKKKATFQTLVECRETDWSTDDNKQIMTSMLMTACDVAAITKPWHIQQRVAEFVAEEFFEQGDIERGELHEEPMAMMDRRKKSDLPSMQVGFIDFICTPVYKLVQIPFPSLGPLYDGVLENRMNWQQKADIEEERQAQNSKATTHEPTPNSSTGTPSNTDSKKRKSDTSGMDDSTESKKPGVTSPDNIEVKGCCSLQ